MFWEIINGLGQAAGSAFNFFHGENVRKENIAREDRENTLTRAREDNAHQREVADLQAAGLSPIANMTGAAATPVTTTSQEAPQMDITAMNDAINTLSQREIADEALEQRKTEHSENLTHQKNVLEETKREFDENKELTKKLKEIDTGLQLAIFNAEQEALIEKANAVHENESKERRKALSSQSEDNYKTFCETVGTTVKKKICNNQDEYFVELQKFEDRYNLFLDFLATDKKWSKKNIDINTYEANSSQGGGGAGAGLMGVKVEGHGQAGISKAHENRGTFKQSKIIEQAWNEFQKKQGINGEFVYPVYNYAEPNYKDMKYNKTKYKIDW